MVFISVGWWHCRTCWCQRRTCLDSLSNTKELTKESSSAWARRFAYLIRQSNGWWPTTMNCVTPGVQGRLHRQMLLQLKSRRPHLKHVLSSPPRGRAEPMGPASDNTICYAKSQSTHNNWLSPTSPRSTKDLSKI